MRPPFLRYAALAGIVLGCASTQGLRTEYALDPAEHPSGIDCFYGCLRHGDDEVRRSCLLFCEGIQVTQTYDACAAGSPALCRSYPAGEPMPSVERSVDEEGDDAVAELMGRFLVAVVRAALGTNDDDDDDDERPSARKPRVNKPAAPPRGPKPWRERRERRK